MEARRASEAAAATPPPRRRSLRQRFSDQPVPPKDSATALLVSGAAAGGVSKLLTAPIDRVKIMYQVSTSRPFTVKSGMRTAVEIVRTAGVSGLWRGNSIAVVRDVPYAAIMFSVRARWQLCTCLCTMPMHDASCTMRTRDASTVQHSKARGGRRTQVHRSHRAN